MDGRMGGEKGLKLFGVRIVDEDRRWSLNGAGDGKDDPVKQSMLKSLSMVDLATCTVNFAGERRAGDHGYLSDGGLEQAARRGGQERKRGVPWSEEEHRTFLAGLEKLGRGDWRGISRNFVMTRTPTQVASHAQKYFLRQSNPNKKKRRSSLFDVVTSKKELTDPNTKFTVSDEADPTFFNLSLPICPPQKVAKPSTIDNSDLELTIAPPQSHHSLAKFSSGIIRVVV